MASSSGRRPSSCSSNEPRVQTQRRLCPIMLVLQLLPAPTATQMTVSTRTPAFSAVLFSAPRYSSVLHEIRRYGYYTVVKPISPMVLIKCLLYPDNSFLFTILSVGINSIRAFPLSRFVERWMIFQGGLLSPYKNEVEPLTHTALREYNSVLYLPTHCLTDYSRFTSDWASLTSDKGIQI